MVCTVCGHTSDEQDRFCSSCGATLSANLEHTGIIPLLEDDAAESDSWLPESGSNLNAGNAQLIVRRGPLEGVRFTLPANREQTITIGRASENDIFLDDVTVSRKHARFDFDGTNWILNDAGSLNGTYVNRERVETAILQDQDEVQVGKFRFIFITAKDTQAK